MIILSLYTTQFLQWNLHKMNFYTLKKYISQEVAQDYANQMIDEMKESGNYIYGMILQ